ncbi:hypothetical protein DRW07_16450 [Alteromonas sediminis]|uniref:Polymer-forming cytoskeletal protein n=1 Tax=Alteromonas sediminis TaxID=2259342 RepID=A0A3N5Z4H3_9ALTE|nr:hypothetical protein [Alteromonas sediminis]RPJ64914.1 hypothetical protein DRW07_16450 [Alteromonas sediminis]
MYKKRLAAASLFLSLSLSGCVIHINDSSGVSSILGNVSVSAHKSVGDVSSVNGNVELLEFVSAQEVDTVNGNIDMANDVSVFSIDVVNGDIVAGERLKVATHIESVNGNITINDSSRIEGSIDSVNGDIQLTSTQIGEHVITQNGDITLQGNTFVSGNIVFEKARSNHRHTPTLTIKNGSNVGGDIVLYRKVKLDIADPVVKNKVKNRWAE